MCTDVAKAIVDKLTDVLALIRAAAPNFTHGQCILYLYVIPL